MPVPAHEPTDHHAVGALPAGLDVVRAAGVLVDGVDRLLLAEAAPLLSLAPAGTSGTAGTTGTAGPAGAPGPAAPGTEVVVLDDADGALTLTLLAAAPAHPGWGVRVHQDRVTDERALDAHAARLGVAEQVQRGDGRLDAALLGRAGVVLLRLPKSLDALEEQAQAVARYAPPEVVLLAAGRDKHMTRGMNEVLERSFAQVSASLGRFKSRALVARAPLATAREAGPTFPRRAHLAEVDLDVVAHGGVFAGTRLDIGTRYLLDFLPQMAPRAQDAVDLGCGTGVLATVLARSRPGLRVLATDLSAAAVASTRATARANGVGDAVTVLRDDALATVPDGSADLVVCNPPFHSGTALETDAAQRMFRACARVLRPGGELWTVYNSHLRYKRDLARVVGPTTMAGQNPKFTVTRSLRG